jgi:hypothetical protein
LHTHLQQVSLLAHACCPTLWPSPSRSHTRALACTCARSHTKHTARAHTLLPPLPLSLFTLSRYVLFVVFYSLSFTHTHTHTHVQHTNTHRAKRNRIRKRHKKVNTLQLPKEHGF